MHDEQEPCSEEGVNSGEAEAREDADLEQLRNVFSLELVCELVLVRTEEQPSLLLLVQSLEHSLHMLLLTSALALKSLYQLLRLLLCFTTLSVVLHVPFNSNSVSQY